jgi:hypothetical protein
MDQIQQQVKGAGLLRQQRLTQLQTELQPWINDWEMIGRRLAPQHGRWLNDANQRNRPRTSESIDVIDNTGTMAVQTLQNGMMSLAFSPARRFWKGTIADKDLAEWQPVSEHLAIIDDAVGTVLAMSNFYRVTHEGFAPLGVFGMNAVHLRQHPKRGMWLYPYEIGEYSVAGNEENEIDTIYRQFAMTTVQIVEQFGWAAVSDRVKTSWNHGHLGHWHTVVHAIEPRAHRKPQSLAARDMPFASIYWELSQSKTDEVLRESGYEEFPVVVPRWSTRCGEVYGYGAGTYAVGDTGALNHLGYRSSQLVDFGVEPPVQGPSAHSQDEPSFLPGSLTHNEQPGTQPFKPVWQPTLSLGELNVERMDTRQRINRAFFVDMFLMLSNISDTTQRTAAEVAKRAEEQLVQAGPVVSRINREYGEPVLKFAFRVAQQMGLIPPPPEELQGQRWEIEFDSVFVQAQKLIGTANNDRFMASIGPVLAYDQTQVDVLDGEAIIRDYASRYSIRPKNLRSPKKVAERQQSRAAAMAAKEQSAILAEQAGAASNLAGAAATGGAPADQLSQLVGYNSPPAQSY